MFSCRAAWQRCGPLARKAAFSLPRDVVQRRQMSSVPGGSGDNILYALLCGGAFAGALGYAYSTVTTDHARYNDRISDMNARPKVEWQPKPWPPKSRDEGEEEEAAAAEEEAAATEEEAAATEEEAAVAEEAEEVGAECVVEPVAEAVEPVVEAVQEVETVVEEVAQVAEAVEEAAEVEPEAEAGTEVEAAAEGAESNGTGEADAS